MSVACRRPALLHAQYTTDADRPRLAVDGHTLRAYEFPACAGECLQLVPTLLCAFFFLVLSYMSVHAPVTRVGTLICFERLVLSQLRSAWGIARSLGRVLIMPAFVCGEPLDHHDHVSLHGCSTSFPCKHFPFNALRLTRLTTDIG